MVSIPVCEDGAPLKPCAERDGWTLVLAIPVCEDGAPLKLCRSTAA